MYRLSLKLITITILLHTPYGKVYIIISFSLILFKEIFLRIIHSPWYKTSFLTISTKKMGKYSSLTTRNFRIGDRRSGGVGRTACLSSYQQSLGWSYVRTGCSPQGMIPKKACWDFPFQIPPPSLSLSLSFLFQVFYAVSTPTEQRLNDPSSLWQSRKMEGRRVLYNKNYYSTKTEISF